MENKLKAMFDYQRFEPNDRLSRLIDDTESRYMSMNELSDSDLELVSAAAMTDFKRDARMYKNRNNQDRDN